MKTNIEVNSKQFLDCLFDGKEKEENLIIEHIHILLEKISTHNRQFLLAILDTEDKEDGMLLSDCISYVVTEDNSYYDGAYVNQYTTCPTCYLPITSVAKRSDCPVCKEELYLT